MVVAMWYGIKGWNSFGVFVCVCVCIYIYICVCVCVCVCVFCIYVCLIVSLSYLLVFGDDRVRGTREQMML